MATKKQLIEAARNASVERDTAITENKALKDTNRTLTEENAALKEQVRQLNEQLSQASAAGKSAVIGDPADMSAFFENAASATRQYMERLEREKETSDSRLAAVDAEIKERTEAANAGVERAKAQEAIAVASAQHIMEITTQAREKIIAMLAELEVVKAWLNDTTNPEQN